ncbi:hypothetical protein BJ742DRAFT_738842 [Cladochytrium replicatum]|nr:hypothetical protein BJ742DRAFT_738842 [Cladochytrium replicatum]
MTKRVGCSASEIQLTHEKEEEIKKEAEQLAQMLDVMKSERDGNNKTVVAEVQKVADKVVHARKVHATKKVQRSGGNQTSLQLKEQMAKEAEEERARGGFKGVQEGAKEEPRKAHKGKDSGPGDNNDDAQRYEGSG